MLSRYFLLAKLLLLLGLPLLGCNLGFNPVVTPNRGKPNPYKGMIVGIVSYEAGDRYAEKYERFKEYLAEQTQDIVELEPSFNELRAVEQIQRGAWSIVFAPPGLAAIAISKEKYIPIFRLEGVDNLRSVLVVQEDSPIQSIADLANRPVALGQPGSATGYYLPLYDLYGLTLAEVRFAPTPRTVLEWLSQGTVAAGALSEDEFQSHRREFGRIKFRILHTSRAVPPGVVLLGPTVERNQEKQIKAAMRQVPGNIAADTGYIPNAQLPNYEQFIKLVEKVRPLEARVREKPAILRRDLVDE